MCSSSVNISVCGMNVTKQRFPFLTLFDLFIFKTQILNVWTMKKLAQNKIIFGVQACKKKKPKKQKHTHQLCVRHLNCNCSTST